MAHLTGWSISPKARKGKGSTNGWDVLFSKMILSLASSFTTSYALKNGLVFDPLGDNIPSGSGGSDAGKPSWPLRVNDLSLEMQKPTKKGNDFTRNDMFEVLRNIQRHGWRASGSESRSSPVDQRSYQRFKFWSCRLVLLLCFWKVPLESVQWWRCGTRCNPSGGVKRWNLLWPCAYKVKTIYLWRLHWNLQIVIKSSCTLYSCRVGFWSFVLIISKISWKDGILYRFKDDGLQFGVDLTDGPSLLFWGWNQNYVDDQLWTWEFGFLRFPFAVVICTVFVGVNHLDSQRDH